MGTETPILACMDDDSEPGSDVGGTLFEIDTVAVFVAAVGVNTLITGLVVLTLAGVAGQAAWLVHKRKKKKD